MAASGSGPGSGATPGLEAATLQKLALRRKKVLSAEEMELYELAQAAGAAIDPDVFKILVDLLNLNVAPLAVYQMLKAMCAGQRLASEPQDPLPTSGMPETREASFPSARNSSPPARPSFSSALLLGPAATPSPLSPGPPASLRFSCCLFSPFAGHLIKLDEEAGEARGSKVRAHGWSRPKSGSRGVPEGDSLKLSRGRNKGSATVLAERSSRDGSSQRLPRQPSASRLPKGAAPAKSPTRSNS
ncbi:mitotic-spindle organizing protein 2B isoform X1 [Ochotona princeps]|uniref:mitotic-spindle organizing protein 2B isoform X1 n=1 Tax=Ochotona princeps TaxID=9978 RepID=UPI002714D86F|nr:mitotic-spindle organizing protein 2B isoform X1 [Ochotona princeps]